jgi:hypothetical protein
MEHYRIVADVGLYYITFPVIEWLPIFIDESAGKIITDSFNFCMEKKYLGVNAYVIMPTHLHAILFDVEFNAERLKHILDDIRKFTGRQLLDYSAKHLPKVFTEVFHQQAGNVLESGHAMRDETCVGYWAYPPDVTPPLGTSLIVRAVATDALGGTNIAEETVTLTEEYLQTITDRLERWKNR